MHSPYNVPIIPQNLRREETVIQIADALNYLSQVSNDIFNRINTRIETNSKHLLSISDRIEKAGLKVSNLKGAKKATQVFSSSKYPAVDVHRQYKSVFSDAINLEIKRSKIKYKDVQVKNEPLPALEFYHVKVRNEDIFEDTGGLGNIPNDVASINDLLLYNTGKNPYKKYVISDPLQTSISVKKDDTSEAAEISAAPYSISDKTTLTRSATDSFFYSPDLGDVPTIDVPLDLPDLPGIADDLRYVDELGQGIAPSVTTTPNIPELPPVVEVPQVNQVDSIKLVPPPPPPPIPMIETVTQKTFNEAIPELSLPKVNKEVIEDLKPVSQLEDTLPKPPIPVDNAHASLMEAIRKAGGSKNAKLKSTEPKKAAPPSSDLMADLHAKLSLRRKGISGSKNQDNLNFDAGSAMNKISAMIPAPPTKVEHNESTNTEDEDWDE
ncbi:hypothetical protein RN001_015601 [Aquatica leii]|uniref:WH2 domain-containing protein n=1 Tax=Aquatica leii TaxID=1421715 RepID=A0AAN7PN87_9COLE|nr:hypothetical protein RN001_015601 [Aquatica leii]